MTGEALPKHEASIVRMANQIARNHHHQPRDEAVAAVVRHLRDFWSPTMQAELVQLASSWPELLDDVALAAGVDLGRGRESL